jgi:hypothetical protein
LFHGSSLIENLHERDVARGEIISERETVIVLHRELQRESHKVAIERNHHIELIREEAEVGEFFDHGVIALNTTTDFPQPLPPPAASVARSSRAH